MLAFWASLQVINQCRAVYDMIDAQAISSTAIYRGPLVIAINGEDMSDFND